MTVQTVLDRLPSYLQSLIAVGSLIFGVGILYGDVQDIKREVEQSQGLVVQTQVLQERAAAQDRNQQATVLVLGKLSDNVEKLSTSVARLEGKINK